MFPSGRAALSALRMDELRRVREAYEAMEEQEAAQT